MKYSNINIEDIDNYTLNEAKALYGEISCQYGRKPYMQNHTSWKADDI